MLFVTDTSINLVLISITEPKAWVIKYFKIVSLLLLLNNIKIKPNKFISKPIHPNHTEFEDTVINVPTIVVDMDISI